MADAEIVDRKMSAEETELEQSLRKLLEILAGFMFRQLDDDLLRCNSVAPLGIAHDLEKFVAQNHVGSKIDRDRDAMPDFIELSAEFDGSFQHRIIVYGPPAGGAFRIEVARRHQ
jgi:hypothetical protein